MRSDGICRLHSWREGDTDVELESEESMDIHNSFKCLDGKRMCRRWARANKGRRVVGERWVFPHGSKKC